MNTNQPQSKAEYPCSECGKLRTKAEGGTTFTVCDECWDTREESKKNPTTNDWLILISTEKVAQQTVYELRQQLSDEAAARTEITRKYHDECAALAQELYDERAKCEEMRNNFFKECDGSNKLYIELTTTTARLAEAICLINDVRSYMALTPSRNQNVKSEWIHKLGTFLSSTEPPAIDEVLRKKWLDEVEAIRAVVKQAT